METTKSADGTVIAYATSGDGPPLIVVVGAFCTRQTFVPPSPLTSTFTVYTYDRRGRGDSGDTAPFSAVREYEDLAAVAAVTGHPHPFLFGHSSGAAIALRATAAGLVSPAAIVAYEAPFTNSDTPPVAGDPAQHILDLVAADQRDEAVLYWMRDIVHMPAEMVAEMRHQPWVAALSPLTPTLPYDLAVSGDGVPAQELAAIQVPVLVLGGANSPAWFRRSVREQASSIAGARLTMIDGYDHNAPPEVITPILTEFFT